MKKGSYTILLLFLLLGERNVIWGQSDSIMYSFFIAGHTYGGSGVNNEGLHPPFVDKFEYIQSREEIVFAVFTGDIVSTNPTADDWDEVDQDIDSLGIPVYFAVGNHDMEDRPLFESRYGITYFDFIYEDDLFIILDPNLDEWNISGDQLTFLENTLDSNAQNVENIFVFYHQLLCWESGNIYSQISPNSFEGRADSINYWSEVEPLFTALNNPVFMCMGDLGGIYYADDFMYDIYDNISLLGSGMGEGEGDNIVIINVDYDKNVSYELICLNDTNLNCFGDLESFQLSNGIEYEKRPKLSLYPNPAYDFLTIEFDGTAAHSLEFFSPNGQLIFRDMKIESNPYQLNVSDYPNGLYFLRITSEDKRYFSKIVVNK